MVLPIRTMAKQHFSKQHDVLVRALTVCRILAAGDWEYARRRAEILLEECPRLGIAIPCREGVLRCDVEGVHRHGAEPRETST